MMIHYVLIYYGYDIFFNLHKTYYIFYTSINCEFFWLLCEDFLFKIFYHYEKNLLKMGFIFGFYFFPSHFFILVIK